MEFLAANTMWLLQDVIVLILAAATVFFIVKHEKFPNSILMEMLCFIFLYAMVYENGATLRGQYQYGRSVLMVGNVPFTVGLLEWFVVYGGLRLLAATRVPIWIQPFIVGLFGILQDLTLDPVAVRQITDGVGRWTWREGPDWSLYLGIPIYNFSGWFFITGYAAAAFLIGRSIHQRSRRKMFVGYLYPVLGSIAAVVLLHTPLSMMWLWLAPSAEFGAVREWYALAVWLAVGFGSLLVWRWRMARPLAWSTDWPIFVIPAAMHVSDVVFALAGGFREILPNEFLVTAIHLAIVGGAFYASRAGVRSAAPTRVGRMTAARLN